MASIDNLIQQISASRRRVVNQHRFRRIYHKFSSFTMVKKASYLANLQIAASVSNIEGCVIECGVWRGGMIAGIAEILGADREYHLFDSFEGLPPAREIDGPAAIAWQSDKSGANYHDNCRAERTFAEEAMNISPAKAIKFFQGWFNDTMLNYVPPGPIAILRLDADWYESTIICLNNLASYLAENGVIVIDDYYTWDGCARAVHDFLSSSKMPLRLFEIDGICVLKRLKR